MNHVAFDLSNLPEIICQLLPVVRESKVVTFTGPLGAGKTTLIRSLLVELGVDESVISSPTFAYVHEYRSISGLIVYHFDLYRLSSLDDFFALGFEEYLYMPGSIAFIEWPEIINPILREPMCAIELGYGDMFDRRWISLDIEKIAGL